MSPPLTVRCPQCSTKLKLKDRNKLGKKVACPQCGQPFVLRVEKPDDGIEFALPADDTDGRSRRSSPEDDFNFDEELPDDEFGTGEGYDGYDDEFASPPASPTPRSGTKPKSAKRKASSSDGHTGLIVTLAVFGALVVFGGGGLGIYLLTRGSDTPVAETKPAAPAPPKDSKPVPPPKPVEGQLDLAYLPADAELFVHVRLAEAWKAPILQSLVAGPGFQVMLNEMQQKSGVGPADVESITLAFSGLMEEEKPAPKSPRSRRFDDAPPVPPSQATPASPLLKMVAVARFNKTVDAATMKLTEQGAVAVEHKGKTYYRMPEADQSLPASDKILALFPAAPTLLVAGEESRVKAAIEQGADSKPRPELAYLDSRQHVLVGYVPKDPRAAFNKLIPEQPQAGSGSEAADRLVAALKQGATGVGLGLMFTEATAVQLSAQCSDAKVAQQIQASFEALIADGRQSLQETRSTLPPEIAQWSETIAGTMKATTSGNAVTFALSVPKLEEGAMSMLPGLAMSMSGAAGAGIGVPLAGGAISSALPLGMAVAPPPQPPAEPVWVPMSDTEGVPDGVEMYANARWHPMTASPAGPRNAPAPPALEVAMRLCGPTVDESFEYGMLLEETTSQEGQPLTLQTPQPQSAAARPGQALPTANTPPRNNIGGGNNPQSGNVPQSGNLPQSGNSPSRARSRRDPDDERPPNTADQPQQTAAVEQNVPEAAGDLLNGYVPIEPGASRRSTPAQSVQAGVSPPGGAGGSTDPGATGLTAAQLPPGIDVLLTFAPPDASSGLPDSVRLKGSLKLHTSTGTKEIVLRRLLSRKGKPIRHGEITELGLDLFLEEDDENDSLLLSIKRGDPGAISKVEVVGKEGDPLPGVTITRRLIEGTTTYDLHTTAQFPTTDIEKGDIALNLTLRLGFRELNVPFQFDPLPVPPPVIVEPSFGPAAGSPAPRGRFGRDNAATESVGSGNRPSGSDNVPAGSGNVPAGSGNNPFGGGNAPGGGGNNPAGSGNNPAGSGNNPAGSGNNPAGGGNAPPAAPSRKN